MFSHMRTTVDMPDGLLDLARAVAERRKITLRDLIEEALRASIDAERARSPFRLRDSSFKGSGLQGGLDWSDWESIRSLVYEGHGG
jgi:hypothetical protein